MKAHQNSYDRHNRVPHLVVVLCTVFAIGSLLAAPMARAVSAQSHVGAADAKAQRTQLIMRGIRYNFEGRLEDALEVWQRLRVLDPDDPAPPVLETSTWFWYESFGSGDSDLESKIVASCEEGLKKAKVLRARDMNSAEAHYWYGTALSNLARMYGSSGRFLKAGGVGGEGIEELEAAYKLDPKLVDAHYSPGYMLFYASLLPNLVKWLSFLWFVPTGDAEMGISYLDDVARSGQMNSDDAVLMLMSIHTYHTKEFAKARSHAEALHARFPDNSVIEFELIEIAFAEEDYEGVIKAARRLEARKFTLPRDQGRVDVARIWRARAELALGKTDASKKTLEVFGEGEPAIPSWGAPWVMVIRGQIFDVMGRRDEARARYQAVVDLGESPIFSRSTELALEWQQVPFTLIQTPSVAAQR